MQPRTRAGDWREKWNRVTISSIAPSREQAHFLIIRWTQHSKSVLQGRLIYFRLLLFKSSPRPSRLSPTYRLAVIAQASHTQGPASRNSARPLWTRTSNNDNEPMPNGSCFEMSATKVTGGRSLSISDRDSTNLSNESNLQAFVWDGHLTR